MLAITEQAYREAERAGQVTAGLSAQLEAVRRRYLVALGQREKRRARGGDIADL